MLLAPINVRHGWQIGIPFGQFRLVLADMVQDIDAVLSGPAQRRIREPVPPIR